MKNKKIENAPLEKSKLLKDNKNVTSFIIDDIFLNLPNMYAGSGDELYKSFKSRIKKQKRAKKKEMLNSNDPYLTIKDPAAMLFDKAGEEKFLKNILKKLNELDILKPDKKYISIFYRKYIENKTTDIIAGEMKLSPEEIQTRILEIVKYVNKE